MFLNRLRSLGRLPCSHPDPAFDAVPSADGTDEWVRCRECGIAALSVREFLCREAPARDSPTLAREYAEWTGHVDVPCRFDTAPLQSRVLPGAVPAKFSTLFRGYELLRAIHSPFARSPDGTAADPKTFRNLMSEYMSLIDRVTNACENDDRGFGEGSGGVRPDCGMAVRSLLAHMKDAFANVDMHEQYFEVLAPYVKFARSRVVSGSEEEEGAFSDEGAGDLPFGRALELELVRSSVVHDQFSRYCIPFDVVHVIVLFYLCGDDTDTMFNLVLDMAAKVCSGYFSFPVSRSFDVGLKINRLIELERARRTMPSKLYFLLRNFQDGSDTVADCFGENFLRNYSRLESEIRKRVPEADEAFGNRVDRFVYQQTFPYVLFEENSDEDDAGYYAFVMALAHYVSKSHFPSRSAGGKSKIATVPKGVVAECKTIYRFVRECISRVKAFDGTTWTSGERRNRKRVVYWTRDMFDLFLASSENFAEQFETVIKLVKGSFSS